MFVNALVRGRAVKKEDAYGLRIALVIILFIGIEYVSRSLDHILPWVWVNLNLPVSRVSLEFHLWFIKFGPVVLWGIYAILAIQLLRWKHIYP